MTLNLFKRVGLLSFIVFIFTACGGGGTTPSSAYNRWSNTTAPGTVSIGGSYLSSNTATGARSLSAISGTVTQNSQDISFTTNGYTFTAPSGGFNPDGLSVDSNGATLLANAGLGSGYEFLGVYNGTYDIGGVQYDAYGVIGVVTEIADMPTSGTATMTGQANLIAHTENGGTVQMNNGTVSLVATFGGANPNVDLAMSNFTNTNTSGVTVANAPFTTMTINDMAITGNGYSGGTTSFSTANNVSDPFGAKQTTQVQGTFFGLGSENGLPYETGGVILVQGDTGHVSGIYVATQ